MTCTIRTDKDILHTTHQEVLLFAIQQFQRIVKTNESGDMRTINDVHALLLQRIIYDHFTW